MKKTKEELKEEVMESVQDCESTEEPVEDVDYDAKIEQCRSKLVVLNIFYKEKKSELENEIKELQEKRDMEESVKALNNFITRLVDGGLSRDRAEEIAAEYIRKNMGLGSTEKKRVDFAVVDSVTNSRTLNRNEKFSDVADKMAATFAPFIGKE